MKRLLITLALIIITTLAIIAYRDSQIPRATATVQVHPSLIIVNSQNPNISVTITRNYMESEFRVLLSNETLGLAATLLGILENQQAKAIQLMNENVTTAPIPGTDFITITAKYPDPQQAISTANAIAEAYVQNRTAAVNKRAQKSLKALDEELASQEQRIKSHRQELTKILDFHRLDFPADGQTFLKATDIPLNESNGDADPTLMYHFYNQAVETFIQSNAILREMKIKQEEARMLLKQPRQPITIHERATLTPSAVPTKIN